MENHFSSFISTYRKSFNNEHILIRLLENWRNKLDNNVVQAVWIDLSEAFDCIPHNLLVAKLEDYDFYRCSVACIYSYLKNRKQ